MSLTEAHLVGLFRNSLRELGYEEEGYPASVLRLPSERCTSTIARLPAQDGHFCSAAKPIGM
jgi:hypothetical protein